MCKKTIYLDKIFNEIRFYKSETCENPYLSEFASGLSEKYAERDIIPVILDLFDFEISEFYYCQYYRMRKDARFEDAAIAYLNTHELNNMRPKDLSRIPNGRRNVDSGRSIGRRLSMLAVNCMTIMAQELISALQPMAI